MDLSGGGGPSASIAADTFLYLRDGDLRSGDDRYSNDDHEGAGPGRTTDRRS